MQEITEWLSVNKICFPLALKYFVCRGMELQFTRMTKPNRHHNHSCEIKVGQIQAFYLVIETGDFI